MFSSQGANVEDLIVARLKRPAGFKGPPLFADDRSVIPESDRNCQIKQDKNDPAELAFDLKITDFSRCGVLKRNVSCVFIIFTYLFFIIMISDTKHCQSVSE